MLSRVVLAALVIGAVASSSSSSSPPTADPRADTPPGTSITIYSDSDHATAAEVRGRALVQQRRHVELPQGEGRIEITDIPTTLDPASVLLRPLSDDAPFTILEQHLHDIATDPDSVLRQYVGHEVLINRRQSGPVDQTRLTETINAKLLAFDEKVLVLQTNNRQLPIQIIARGPEITEIKLTPARSMPAMRPTISWQVSTDKPGPRDVDLIYETRGLSWDANYTLLLAGDGSTATLQAWANVVNRSGAPFADADLRLVLEQGAGQERTRVPGAEYVLPRRITLPPDGARRLAMLDGGKRVNISRVNVLAASWSNGVMECLSVANTRENHLGLPLPPGRLRVFRQAENAPTALLAECTVSHTAPKEALIMRLAGADGLVATRGVAESPETIDGDQRVVRVTQVKITNRRKENARVLVIEDLERRAKHIIRHSHPYETSAGLASADAIRFLLEVPAGEAKLISYSLAVDGG